MDRASHQSNRPQTGPSEYIYTQLQNQKEQFLTNIYRRGSAEHPTGIPMGYSTASRNGPITSKGKYYSIRIVFPCAEGENVA